MQQTEKAAYTHMCFFCYLLLINKNKNKNFFITLSTIAKSDI